MSKIATCRKVKYYYPFYKRLFLKSNWEIIDTKYDNIKYYRTFTGNVSDNILIVYHEWNNNSDLVARKIIITSSEDVIFCHLAESKKAVEALHWLNNPKEILP